MKTNIGKRLPGAPFGGVLNQRLDFGFCHFGFITQRPTPVITVSRTSSRQHHAETADQGHRWRRRIESGKARSITDLAAQEKVTIAYVGKVMNLTYLAPDIVSAILDGRQPRGLSVNAMLKDMATGWNQQRRAWGGSGLRRGAGSEGHPPETAR